MSFSKTVRESLQQAILQAKLPDDFILQVENYYYPLAQKIHALTEGETSPLLLSLQGPQGAGKSTLCHFLQLLLVQQFGHQLAVLSLDDFYFDRDIRLKLAQNVHPLLQTRGVPGTHDLVLANNTLSALKQGKVVKLPRFNKADDNPYPESFWPDSPAGVTIILFEGWCNNLLPQPEAELQEPVNALEAQEDKNGIWRSYVNGQVALYHERLFSLSDALLCISIPDFELVYRWRGLQEEKLRTVSADGTAVMDQSQINRFIQHFERLTRHAMQSLPQSADLLITLDESHMIVDMKHTVRNA